MNGSQSISSMAMLPPCLQRQQGYTRGIRGVKPAPRETVTPRANLRRRTWNSSGLLQRRPTVGGRRTSVSAGSGDATERVPTRSRVKKLLPARPHLTILPREPGQGAGHALAGPWLLLTQDHEPVRVVGQGDVWPPIAVDVTDGEPLRFVLRCVRDGEQALQTEDAGFLEVHARLHPPSVQGHHVALVVAVHVRDD